MDASDHSGRRKVLRKGLYAASALWFLTLFLPVRAPVSRISIGIYLLLPLAVSILFLLVWHDSWFGEPPSMRPPQAIAHIARPFFWTVVTALAMVFGAIFIMFVL